MVFRLLANLRTLRSCSRGEVCQSFKRITSTFEESLANVEGGVAYNGRNSTVKAGERRSRETNVQCGNEYGHWSFLSMRLILDEEWKEIPCTVRGRSPSK